MRRADSRRHREANCNRRGRFLRRPDHQLIRRARLHLHLRDHTVLIAREHGIHEAARRFGTTRKAVPEWLPHFLEEGKPGLEDRSRAPHHIPHKTPREPVMLLSLSADDLPLPRQLSPGHHVPLQYTQQGASADEFFALNPHAVQVTQQAQGDGT